MMRARSVRKRFGAGAVETSRGVGVLDQAGADDHEEGRAGEFGDEAGAGGRSAVGGDGDLRPG